MEEKDKKACIFVVDDNAKNLQVLGEILRDEGYTLGFAENGKNAINAIQNILPDLILLDIMMPEMDGFETCRRLKASPQIEEIPVIFLSAKNETVDILKGFDYGAVDYITKPFNQAELLARVRLHLELKFCKELIKQKNTEQKELFHILCHDLVSPMSAIKTTCYMSRGKPDEWFAKKRDFLERAIDVGLDTVELVRKMKSLEDKEAKIKLESTNLKNALDETLNIIQQQLTQKDIKTVIDVDESIAIQVEKTSFISSVLSNILTNAIKFSFPDSKLEISAQKDESNIVLFIKDFGIGMSDKMKSDVFDLTKSVSRKGTSGEKGTGFGLPLVKKFMTAYGGGIEIFSTEKSVSPDNHGTQVRLFFKPA